MDNLTDLQEEIFCLKYELDALAEISLRHKAERWIPNFIDERTNREHWDRYKLAIRYAKDKTILDIACGVGRGSYTLATEGSAKSVTACDIQESAIRYATFRNRHEKISFSIQDAELYKQPDTFDLIVSFETIEHLKNYEAFLQNVYDSLRPKGIFMVSTPISHMDVNTAPVNPYHVQEWGFEKFQQILSKRFSIIKVFTQVIKYEPPLPFMKRALKSLSIHLGMNRHTDQDVDSGFPKMEEYKNQYRVKDLGSKFIGFQTVICEKS
ncbi:MAG TPA: methyltransferase domain-containing protein [Candidatus Babeliaceae bacterium]|nr:methyltransferase domain-containing protein [Candidatus Babeliaceae bacterium]